MNEDVDVNNDRKKCNAKTLYENLDIVNDISNDDDDDERYFEFLSCKKRKKKCNPLDNIFGMESDDDLEDFVISKPKKIKR